MERFKDDKRVGKLAYFVLDKLVIRDRPRVQEANLQPRRRPEVM